MKSTDIQNIINESLFDEVKKTILRENKEGDEVYHIMCDGEPIETFENEDEAMSHLDIYKKKHPEKEFIIEKKKYNSPSDMIDELDKMGEKLEVKENKTMETNKVKNFAHAVTDAKEKGLKEFKLNGEIHNVDESWKQLEEEEFGDGRDEIDMDKNGKITAKDFEMLRNKKKEDCDECSQKMEEDVYEHEDDSYSTSSGEDNEIMEENLCECGGMMSEEGMCSECGSKWMGEEIDDDNEVETMNESNKRTLRLTESEMVNMISRMVSESVPGMDVTKRAQKASKEENDNYMKDVETKLKKVSSFDGADNPEFPKQNGKGDKMVVNATPEQDEYTATHRGGTLADLDYDQEPSDRFKERLKMALEGDPKMGNSQDAANVVKTDTGKNIGKTSEKKKEIEKKSKEVSWGHSWKSPEEVVIVKESKTNMSSILEEEIKRMKKIYGYDEKTQ